MKKFYVSVCIIAVGFACISAARAYAQMTFTVACQTPANCSAGQQCINGGCQTPTAGAGNSGATGNLQTGLPNPSSGANGANTNLPNVGSDLTNPVFPIGGSGSGGTGGGYPTFTPLVQSGGVSGIPGLTDTQTTSGVINQKGLAAFFNHLYKFLIGIAVVLAVGMIIWGGTEIALNHGSVSQAIAGKGKIYNAIWGLVLVLAPAVVFTIINPAILNLNVNFPALNVHQGNYVSAPPCTTGSNCISTSNLMGVTTGTDFLLCSNSSCAAQVQDCIDATNKGTPSYAQVCQKQDGSIDTANPPSNSAWLWQTANYSCSANETLGVNCLYLVAATPLD